MVKKKKIIMKIISYILVFTLCLPFPGFVISPETAKAMDVAVYFAWHDNILWGYTNNDDGTIKLGGTPLDGSTDAAGLADLIKYSQKYPKPAYAEVPKYLDGKLVTGISWLLDPYVEALVLPDTIINIYSGAFERLEKLKSVTIPKSVKYMEGSCFNRNYDGVIYTTMGSEAYKYAVLHGIKYYIIEEPATPSPTATLSPTPTPSPTPTQRPATRPIINQSPTTRPIINQSPSPTVTPSPTATATASPTASLATTLTPDRTPEPVLEATGTPEPGDTPEPDFMGEETPSPEPEYTEKPAETQKEKIEIEVNPAELRADAQGKFYNNSVDISVKGAVSYNAEIKNSPWLKISKRNSSERASEKITFTEENSDIFYVFADKNTTSSERLGSIVITADNGEETETKSIEVKQEAMDAKLSLSVSKITANAKGTPSVFSVNIKTDGTGGFVADNGGYSWIKIGKGSSSSEAASSVSFGNNGTFYIFISENTSNTARSGKIKVTHEDRNTEKIISVSQEGRKTVLEVDAESKTADNKGSFYNNKIFVKTSGTGSFTATVEDTEWLKLSSGSTSSFIDGMSEITIDKDSYIYLYADKNTGDERNAVITITHESGKVTKEITVNQLGKDKAYLNADRESAYFDEPGKGISGMVTVSADDSTKWTVASDSDWIKVIESNTTNSEGYSSIEGAGNGTFYIIVKENNTYNERYGYVTISSPGLEDCEIYVYQVENEISIKSLLEEVSVIVTKKTFKKGRTSKIKLDYPEGLYESDIKSVKFSSNKKKVATVSKKGVIKGIKKGKAVITIKITLEDGSSKTFKAKVTVDKRKVKLSKFK